MSVENIIRKLQIGVTDLRRGTYIDSIDLRAAEEVGFWIANGGAILMLDTREYIRYPDTIVTAACRGAKEGGGLIVGVAPNNRDDSALETMDIVVATGIKQKEKRAKVSINEGIYPLLVNCDCLIAFVDGNTLNELVTTYKLEIPIVAYRELYGGMARVDPYIDESRRPRVFFGPMTPKLTVEEAFEQGANYLTKFQSKPPHLKPYKTYIAPTTKLERIKYSIK